MLRLRLLVKYGIPKVPKAIFFNVPTSGHVNPSLPLVAELIRRGEQISYYLTPAYQQKVEATGAQFRAYDVFGAGIVPDDYFDSRGLDGSNPPGAAAALLETSALLVPQIIDLLRAEQPDYVLFDAMCPWGWIAARHLGLPSVSSQALLALRMGLMLRSGKLPTLIGNVVSHLDDIRRFQTVSARMKAAGYRVPGFPAVLVSDGTITINYTSALFQPGAESIGAHVKFVGPAIAPRPHDPEFPFELLEGKQVIYISLGTVINRNEAFYRQCYAAFADTPYQVVLSVGERIRIPDLGPVPANFIVRSFVPQLEVLQHADLFITHAGMNSTQEGLYYDVPLLLVPQQAEQSFVASRVEALGAGIRLEGQQVTADRLRSVAERILHEPKYKQRAAWIGESLRSAGGIPRAADEILRLVAQRKTALT